MEANEDRRGWFDKSVLYVWFVRSNVSGSCLDNVKEVVELSYERDKHA